MDPKQKRMHLRKRAPKFDFFEVEEQDSNGIVILDGDFAHLKYSYGVISFSGIDEKGDLIEGSEPSVNFTYDIIDNPDNYDIDQSAIDVMGSVLSVLLDAKYGEPDEPNDGEDDPDESSSG